MSAQPPKAPFAPRLAGEEETLRSKGLWHTDVHRGAHTRMPVFTRLHTHAQRGEGANTQRHGDRQTDTWVRTQRIPWPPEESGPGLSELGLPGPPEGPFGQIGRMAQWLSLMALWEECAAN